MGVVYRATDLRLEREVALKFLAHRFGDDPRAKRRFLQEARAVAGLDHPNICTVHEIDEEENGGLYLVMAYYDGRSLRQALAEGPLPVEDALEWARQLLDGLGRAHEVGIVHRDVKPGNLMLTGYRQLKILDFGLAKLSHATHRQARSGHVHGTAAYMAPEQARGEAVDHRCDLWSVGVVLFQMLTGSTPFEGPDATSMLHSVVHDEPAGLLPLRPEIPLGLEDVVLTALQKDPDLRYPTARVMAEAMVAATASRSSTASSFSVAAPGEALRNPSILVLPMMNASGSADHDHLADGLTDELITDLSLVDSLQVISRTSAMQLKSTDKDVPTLSRELGVRYVLEGALRVRGDLLRVTAKLIDARSDTTLWADKFSGSVDDLLDIEERLSREIVDAFKLQLSARGEEKISERPIPEVRAYECYLKARQYILGYTAEGLDRALRLLDEAETIIGENPLLLSARSYVHWQAVNAGFTADRERLAVARTLAERVLALEPHSPRGHGLLGLLSAASADPQAAVGHLKIALGEDPNDVDALSWMVAIYSMVGYPATGLPIAERLLRVDPLTPFHHALVGLLRQVGGDPHGALRSMEKGLELEPENDAIQFLRGQTLSVLGRGHQALLTLEGLVERSPGSLVGGLGACLAAALRDDPVEVRDALSPNVEAMIRADPEYPWFVAQCHALLGRGDEAVDWLRSAVDHGFINYPLLAEHDPHLEPIRDHGGFVELLEEVEERWRSFEP